MKIIDIDSPLQGSELDDSDLKEALLQFMEKELDDSDFIEAAPGVKMADSLRSVGYASPEVALGDVIDNCLDALARKIILEIIGESNSSPVDQINIIDTDGSTGMSAEVLNEALRYGSDTNKESALATNLGRFGMGLKTAGTSIGRRIEVWSREVDGDLVGRALDLDIVEFMQKWVVQKLPTTPDSVEAFNEKIGSPDASGTWVAIQKIDRPKYKNVKGIVDRLKAQTTLRLWYRKFLGAGTCTIEVNGSLLQPFGYDYVDDTVELLPPTNFVLPDGTTLGTVKVINTLDTKHKGGGTRAQGIVIMRNNRDVTTAVNPEWHGIRKWHWHTNSTWVIWEATAEELDPVVSTSLKKDSFVIPDHVQQALGNLVNPTINAWVKTREKDAATRKANASSVENAQQAADERLNSLSRNSNLIKPPEVTNDSFTPESRTRESNKDKEGNDVNNDNKDTQRSSTTRRTPKGDYTFDYVNGLDPEKGGRLFDMEVTRVANRPRYRFMVDLNHPWVSDRLLKAGGEKGHGYIAALDMIIAMGVSEAAAADPSEADDIHRNMATTLRMLAKIETKIDPAPAEFAEEN